MCSIPGSFRFLQRDPTFHNYICALLVFLLSELIVALQRNVCASPVAAVHLESVYFTHVAAVPGIDPPVTFPATFGGKVDTTMWGDDETIERWMGSI